MKSLNNFITESENISFPMEIATLKSRSSFDEIDRAILLVLNLPENASMKEKTDAISNFWVQTYTHTGRPVYHSKTSVIEQIKNRYVRNIKDKEKAEKTAEHNKYLASSEGKRRQKELTDKQNDKYNEFNKFADKIKTDIENTFKDAVGFNVTVKLGMSMNLEICPENVKDGAVVYYENDIFSENKKYSVQTTSWGAVKPGTPEAKIVLIQGVLLGNEKIIKFIEDILEEYYNTLEDYRKELIKLNDEYSDINLKF